MGSRGSSSDAPQRPSPRAPLHLRSTACSEANNAHRRAAAADRSPKVSPRGGSQEQRKRSTRAAELETKLRETQAELKKLREQLAAAEAAKREVKRALVKAKVRVPAAAVAKKRKEEEVALSQGSRPEGVRQNETMEESVTSPATMDVFEVLMPAESVPTENEADSKQEKTMVEKTQTNENDETISAAGGEEEEEGEKKEDGKKREDEEVGSWKAKLLEKEKEVAILLEENIIFKTRAEEEAQRIAESSRSKQEEFTAQLNSIEEQLKESKTKEKQLAAQLETAEGAKATLEMELKRLKVQTEQWRKAAEAAAAALATGDAASGDETGGRRVAERCRSMDKHLGVGYGSWASPLADQDDVDEEDGGGGSRGGRRKGCRCADVRKPLEEESA
ncbi:interactor of constitutive active ROPs 4-like [Curcuma longa]|uniref:interactor of constitutive active ROPs 4-like n=1 Tax=Curcuma longa TaxID=136217 RepID=UPI003D9E2BEB